MPSMSHCLQKAKTRRTCWEATADQITFSDFTLPYNYEYHEKSIYNIYYPRFCYDRFSRLQRLSKYFTHRSKNTFNLCRFRTSLTGRVRRTPYTYDIGYALTERSFCQCILAQLLPSVGRKLFLAGRCRSERAEQYG